MKNFLSGFMAICLIACLLGSAAAQTGSRRREVPRDFERRNPAIIVISDHQLLNYATHRSGDLFTVTIYQVGNFRTISGGQPFEQQQPPGTNDLVISFQLQPSTNPQLEQKGNQLSVFFESVSLPHRGISRGMPGAPGGGFDSSLNRSAQVTRVPQNRANQLAGIAVSPISTGDQDERVAVIQPLDLAKLAESKSPTSRECEPTEPVKDDDKDGLVIIDANTGKILEGATRVGENTRVKVVFVNKNPFKYDYSFQLIPKDVSSPTVVSFLNLIPGLPAIPGVSEGTIESANALEDTAKIATAASRLKQAGIDAAPSRDECDAFVLELDTAVKNSEGIGKALKDSAALLKAASDAYTAFVKGTDKTFSGGGRQARMAFAKSLCDAGQTALPKLQALLDFDFDAFAKSLKLDVFSAQVTLLENRLSSLQCDEARKALYKKVIDALKVDVATYKTKLEELKKGLSDSQKKLEGPTKIIKAALGSSNSFAEAAYAPSLGDATSVSITITRKNLRDETPKDEVIAVSPPIEIGESRVVLSAGLGFSTINERKIIRQQSLVPDASGDMVLGNRFGFENRSQFRPSGLVMINGILTRFNFFGTNKASFALSGGLVFSNRNDGLATEFIAGPSLGFANNKLFLTFGFHAARVEELSGGFKIGDPVPDGLTDPLPVQKNWLNGLIMGLTFKIQ